MYIKKKKGLINNHRSQKQKSTPLGIEPRISGSVDQRLIHWAMESLVIIGVNKYIYIYVRYCDQ